MSYQSFVGVDLHKCTVTLAAVSPEGEKIAWLKISTKSTGKIEEWLSALPRPVHLAVEACPFVEWFIDRFTPCVGRIDIADATELASRRGKRRKTDRNDALDIAQRLARGECPLGYIAPAELMQLRKLGRHWRSLSRLLSRTKHAMKSMLHQANIRGPQFDGAAAQRWFLAHRDLLGAVQQDAFEDFIDILNLVERQRGRLHRQMIFASRGPTYGAAVSRLMTVPGIAEVWAVIITAEVGPFDRFPNADALEFWSGLTADLKESAGRTQSGHITKAGSTTLRWALGKAAVTLCQCDARQEATRQRLIRRVGKPRANVAMARRLLRILYAMMRDGKAYEGGPRRDRTAAANRARLGKNKQVA
jgi:transposase